MKAEVSQLRDGREGRGRFSCVMVGIVSNNGWGAASSVSGRRERATLDELPQVKVWRE